MTPVGRGNAFVVHVALFGGSLLAIPGGIAIGHPIVSVVGALGLSGSGVAAVVGGSSLLMPKGGSSLTDADEDGTDQEATARVMGVLLAVLGLALAVGLARFAL